MREHSDVAALIAVRIFPQQHGCDLCLYHKSDGTGQEWNPSYQRCGKQKMEQNKHNEDSPKAAPVPQITAADEDHGKHHDGKHNVECRARTKTCGPQSKSRKAAQ
jgi:hypothetical protein